MGKKTEIAYSVCIELEKKKTKNERKNKQTDKHFPNTDQTLVQQHL